MMSVSRVVSVTLTAAVTVALWTACQAFNCKFPNEGCESDGDCCSGKCKHAHPGTNARCTKLSIHRPCLYTYQCEDRLRCGKDNTCCANYWGVCSHKDDCCDPDHYCYEVEGFYYKRCLYKNNMVADSLSPPLWASPPWMAFTTLMLHGLSRLLQR